MYLSTPIDPLLYEAGLTSASIILNYCQRLYAYWLFSFPDQLPAKEILPISFRIEDRTSQSDELPDNNLMWIQDARHTLYGQWLAEQMTIDHSNDPADGVELVEDIKPNAYFQEKVIMKCNNSALKEATRY